MIHGREATLGCCELVYLIALIFRIADRDAQQRFRIQELQEARRQRIGGIVDIRRPNGALRSNEAKVRAWPLRLGVVERAGERLNVAMFQPCGCGSMRRLGRVRGDAQVLVVRRSQGLGHFLKRCRFHRMPFNARVSPGRAGIAGKLGASY